MPDTLKFPVAEDQWDTYLNAFKEALKQEPCYQGPNKALFTLNPSLELEIKKAKNPSGGTNTLQYIGVEKQEYVQLIYDLMPKIDEEQKPYSIYITDTKGAKTVNRTITLAQFKLSNEGILTSGQGGVIHNPPDEIQL